MTGKRFVVAGAAGGMGQELTRQLLLRGANLVLLDQSGERLEEFCRQLDEPARVSAHACDLTSEEDVTKVAKAARDVDGLANVQGQSPFESALKTSAEQWHVAIDANLTSVFLTCREFGREMVRKGRGSIVNFSSSAGLFGVPSMAAYSAAKHGVVGLTKALAIEWGRAGVRVNCVCPGATITPMLMATSEEYRDRRTERVPLGRLADPVDQALAAAFLLSDEAAYITGTALPVDGGISALAPGTAATDINPSKE